MTISFRLPIIEVMKQSEFFIPTLKDEPKNEEAINAKLLLRAGFIDKVMAGVYVFLPLGLRVLRKIEGIVREEMNKIGAMELLMPSLHPKENWKISGRWDNFDALFKIKSRHGNEYALGPTHEEIIYPLSAKIISSYKDLPVALYQIQNKFRDEPRAKSGLLRGREFLMKDLYSFHEDEDDRNKYYEKTKKSYLNIFKKLSLNALPTEASGGTFSDLSLEFQTPSEKGEDIIFYCDKCHFSRNEEIAGNLVKCPNCGEVLTKKNSIEVGNIFPLKENFAKDFGVYFKDKNGEKKLVSAGCYGLGISRAMAAAVETNFDEKGIIWPESIAPFKTHLLVLGNDKKAKNEADKLYEKFLSAGIEILYDDRNDKTAGEKFSDADLLGIPYRIVISEKTVKAKKVEVKKRNEKIDKLVTLDEFLKKII